jgi:hypothetical protein
MDVKKLWFDLNANAIYYHHFTCYYTWNKKRNVWIQCQASCIHFLAQLNI